MVVRYRQEVRSDIDETVDWYESRELGLGRQFNAELSVLIDRIAANPESFPVHARRTRRAVLQRFHQVVFYVIESDHVLVTGVFDGRRHPRSWSDRVREPAHHFLVGSTM